MNKIELSAQEGLAAETAEAGARVGSDATTTITNPILRGFNPDPSICRVGDDYYIATSTFEWYPGVQIHHSTDLKHWTLVARPLNRPQLLDMLGNPDSCGIWAPCLTYDDGLFYLLYTNVRRFDGFYKDTPNYLTTCEQVDGDWSDPVYLNSSGFDPSLFHAGDGRKYVSNMVWDHRSEEQSFGGIILQEYSVAEQKLVGPREMIYRGSDLGRTEGPHIYFRNGYYYLMTAEGGTSYEHAVTMARATDIWGPYETDPIKHIVTSKDTPSSGLQKAGHGDMVETPSGEVFVTHLVGRPLENTQRCPLGRETAIQKMKWTDDGWLRMDNDGNVPQEVILAGLPESGPSALTSRHYSFDGDALDIDFQWLRTPWPEEFMSLSDQPGKLRLYGMESIGSWFKQALVARRQQSFHCMATTRLSFSCDTFQAAAGLVAYYNTQKFHYLHITHDEEVGMCLNIMSCKADREWKLDYPIESIPLNSADCEAGIYLRCIIHGAKLSFAFSVDGSNWTIVKDDLDASLLSDDCGTGANFTGNFLGMACQDTSGLRTPADFEYFDYQEL